MSPDEKDPVEETPEPKPKPKRTQKTSSSGTGKPAAKKKKPTAAQVEKEASEKAAESVPKAEGDDADAPAASEPPAVEASSEEDKPKPPAKKPRARKKADDAAKAEETKPADKKPAGKPARKRDQPRKRQPGEAPVLVSAKARYVRTSARKARLVCDHIRGKDVEQARAILSFTPRGAAKPWMKLLESAIANAEHNHELVGDELKIASVHADEGPTLKRYRPRAMGRATRIRKRTSHLSITLTPKE
jgi:ribosomal protein L22